MMFVTGLVVMLVLLGVAGIVFVSAICELDRSELDRMEASGCGECDVPVPAGFTRDMLQLREYCRKAGCERCPFDTDCGKGEHRCRLHGVPLYWELPPDMDGKMAEIEDGSLLNAVQAALSGLFPQSAVRYLEAELGPDFLSDLSESIALLVCRCDEMRYDWGDRAEARMVRVLDIEISRWFATRHLDRVVRIEAVTDAVMAVCAGWTHSSQEAV